MDNGQWTMDRGQGTGDNGQWTMDNGQGTGDREQGTGNRGQGTGDREQGTMDNGQGTAKSGTGNAMPFGGAEGKQIGRGILDFGSRGRDGFLSRHRNGYQLSIVNYQLSIVRIVNCQLSIVNCQLSIVRSPCRPLEAGGFRAGRPCRRRTPPTCPRRP